MKRKAKKKGLLITIISILLVVAIGGGCLFYFGGKSAEPVNVYPFLYLGMTEYWGDSQESYGPVTTDKTQTVTEILVQPGDTVQKGDLLMTFDTTLTDIALERERLKVEKLKLELEDAEKELKNIKNMKPMVVPKPDNTEEEKDLGMALSGPYLISSQKTYDGSSQDKALICWLAADTPIDDALLSTIHQTALEYRAANAPTPEVPESTDPTEESTEAPTDPIATLSEEPTEPTEAPTDPTEPPQPQADPNVFYVVFKVTEANMSLGSTLTWQGLEVTASGSGYRFSFYDAGGFSDHTQAAPTTPEKPEVDMGSGLTSAQIAELRSQQEKLIRDLQFQIKMAEADYKIKLTEVESGDVLATIDGTVVSLLDPEEAQLTQQPVLKVSGGGGFYMEGSVSELQKDNLQIGQEVTVNDWNTGMTYTGSVTEVSDYPLPDNGGYYGAGNPNVSLYPFTVFIDGSADLQEGSYVSVMFSAAAAESGIYLENPFLLEEDGQHYVYLQGADGLLEKRAVTVGKSLWGSYTEILSGITEDDLIAFPYGKAVKPGAETQESDISELYQ